MGSGPILRAAPVFGVAFCVLAAVAAGCASNYLDPTLDEKNTGPSARLVIHNRSADVATFTHFEDSARCGKPRAISDAAVIAPNEEADIGVAAGRDFTFAARRIGAEECTAIATFRPDSGKRYLAQFGSSGSACWLNVVRVDSVVPPKVVPEPTLRARRASPEARGAACAAE
jgi:hypothetical protein